MRERREPNEFAAAAADGGRGRVRTCDPYGVNVVLYR